MRAGAALANAASFLGTRLDAELLLAHVLGASRASIVARDERELTPEEQGDFEHLIERRLAGEPLAYLTGTKEFWSIELEVTPDVLVPRPETELLVEWALAVLPRGSAREVLDIGTGSGAIALALAQERPQARIVATDISPKALWLAHANAQRLGLKNVAFARADVFTPAPSGPAKSGKPAAKPAALDRFELIVSNPPYVAEGDPHLDELRFEPRLALTSGNDGLGVLRRVVAEAPRHLVRDGWLLVEHGAEQGAAVRELFAQAGFDSIRTRRDLAGHERATGGCKP